MNRTNIHFVASIVVAAAAISSARACPFCKVRHTGLFIGETTLMGSGTARSWIDIGKDGKPTALGVTMSKLAFENLPDNGTDGMGPEFRVSLPKQAAQTPFDHVAIDWNPKGHEPAGIYDKPHFDFHFYTVPTTTRSQITCKGENVAVTNKKPAPAFMPAGYFMVPKSQLPYMGSHWASMSFPELNGKPFTSSLIYGSYDGKLAFIEPMITLDFLLSKPDFTSAVPMPEKVAKAGYYPSEYRVSYDAQREEYTVAYQKFVWRAAATPAKITKRTGKSSIVLMTEREIF